MTEPNSDYESPKPFPEEVLDFEQRQRVQTLQELSRILHDIDPQQITNGNGSPIDIMHADGLDIYCQTDSGEKSVYIDDEPLNDTNSLEISFINSKKGVILEPENAEANPQVLDPNVFSDYKPLSSLHQEYLEIIQLATEVPRLQLDEDRRNKLLENLDRRKAELHAKGARNISDHLKKQNITLSRDGNKNQPDPARVLFNALHLIWLRQNQILIFSYDQLRDKEDLVQKRLIQGFGVTPRISLAFVHGQMPEEGWYNVQLGPEAKPRLREIVKAIDETVSAK